MLNKYNMDSISLVYPALGGHIFRVSAIFKSDVNIEVLKKSLFNLKSVYPIVYTHLEKTFTGYKHVDSNSIGDIEIGEKWITKPDLFNPQSPAFKIYVENNILSIDFFHGNADGTMANTFLTALVNEYCTLLDGVNKNIKSAPTEEQLDDPYKMFYEKVKSTSLGEDKSFNLTLKTEDYDYYKFSCFNIKTQDIKDVFKNKGYTVNDFLCCCLYKAIYIGTDAYKSNQPITISIGIDLRKRFNLDSHRNFIFFYNIRFPNSLKGSLGKSLKHFKVKVQDATSTNTLKSDIASVYSVAKNPIIKYCPRIIKDKIIKLIYCFVSSKGVTTTFSNIGVKSTNDCCRKYVERFEAYLGVVKGKVNAMAIGFDDNVSLCITYNSKDKRINNEIENILKCYGISYKLTEREFY